MTAKRFIIMDNLPKGTHSNIWDKQKQHNQGIGDELWLGEVVAMLNEGVILAEENEQLKSELSRYKEVNRLDIWKSSYSSEDALITELQIKCDKKQEHIVLLENKIHRMRENIKRLEALYHYRGYIGSGDVKKEYYRMEKLLRAENDQLKQDIDYWKQVASQNSNELNVFEHQLNELNNENKELKAEIIKWKSKYCDAMDTVIGEYSTNIKEDMEELEKEVWGDIE